MITITKSKSEFCDSCGKTDADFPIYHRFKVIKLKELIEAFTLCEECTITLCSKLSLG